MKVFFDADALFTAASSKTAASFGLANSNRIVPVTSAYCFAEVRRVFQVKRVDHFLEEQIARFSLLDNEILAEARKFYEFAYDPNDEHVIKSAITSQAKFLVTYNLKHYDATRIENEFDIKVVKPSYVLFYLRNVDAN